MTVDEALTLIARGEGQTVEFKTSFAEENKAIRSLGAFAHAEGGTVFFGVKPDGSVLGVEIGANTLENFSNRLLSSSQPPLYAGIEVIPLDKGTVVQVSVKKAAPSELHHVFNDALIRVGPTNQVMSTQEQRNRLSKVAEQRSEDRDRPRFDVEIAARVRLEGRFTPEFKVVKVSGDPISAIEWQFRGPRFKMSPRQAKVSALDRTKLVATFDLSTNPTADHAVAENEIGLEIGFYWRGRRRIELHRWPLSRKALPAKALWDIGDERLPALELDPGGVDAGITGYRQPLKITPLVDDQRQAGKTKRTASLRVEDLGGGWLEDCYAKITSLLWEGGGTINGEYRPYWIPWPRLPNPNLYLRWKGFESAERMVRFQASGIVEVALPFDLMNSYYIAAALPQDSVIFNKGSDFALQIEIGAKDRTLVVKSYRLSVHPPTFDAVYVPGVPDDMEFEEIEHLPV